MSDNEFRWMVKNWLRLLVDRERENPEALRNSLCELFFETCEINNTQGIIVWKGNMGCYPTELIWIEDSETFIEHALKEAGLTEEVGGHGETVH
jgi:hypothetical protein